MCAEAQKNEETIYHEAVSKPPKEREAYIKAACGIWFPRFFGLQHT